MAFDDGVKLLSAMLHNLTISDQVKARRYFDDNAQLFAETISADDPLTHRSGCGKLMDAGLKPPI
jgi:hypothetical protein